MGRQKSGKVTAAAKKAAAKKAAEKKKIAPPPVRGRSRLVDKKCLCNITEDRALVTSTIEEETGEHHFVSVVNRYGYPKTASFNCADCQFQSTYDEFLYEPKDEKYKKNQTHQICLECSYHWRGPSLYYVCRGCSSSSKDDEGEDSGSYHEGIFNELEPRIDSKLQDSAKLVAK
jgi:hypothetical protein